MQKEKKCIQIKNDYKLGNSDLTSSETINKVQYIQDVFANIKKCNEIWH